MKENYFFIFFIFVIDLDLYLFYCVQGHVNYGVCFIRKYTDTQFYHVYIKNKCGEMMTTFSIYV